MIRTEGKTRVYQMDDGSVETREGGTVAWRNNNPGNLKFECANSADKTIPEMLKGYAVDDFSWAPPTHRHRSTPSPARPWRSPPRTPGAVTCRACS